MGEHLTNTYNSPLDGSRTHDLGCSIGYPLTLGKKEKEQVLSHSDKPKKEEIAMGSVVGNLVTQCYTTSEFSMEDNI